MRTSKQGAILVVVTLPHGIARFNRDTIPRMAWDAWHRTQRGGSPPNRTGLPLILLILVLCSLAGTPTPGEPAQPEPQTPVVLATDIELPSPTVGLPTATLAPTSAASATPSLELPPSSTPP